MVGAARQMVESGSCPLSEVEGEELDDQVIILDPHHAAGKVIVFQPDTKIGGSVVLCDVCWRPHFHWKLCLPDCTPEGTWNGPRWVGTTLMPLLGRVQMLFFFLLPPPVVEDVVGVVDIS